MDYLFPQEEICNQQSDELFALINTHLPVARDMVDGVSSARDEQIDYAQDVIEQARDVLVGRGVAISAELRQMLSFLDWCTPAEKDQQQAAQKEADLARASAVMEANARLRPLAETFKQEAESFLLPNRRRLAIRLSEIAPQLRLEVKVEHSTGRKFKEAKQRFERLLGEQIAVWCVGSCWNTPVEDDTDFSFALRLPVCSDGRFYAMVRNLVCSSATSRVLIRLEGDECGAWELVTEPFETHKRVSVDWKAVQGILKAAPTVFA